MAKVEPVHPVDQRRAEASRLICLALGMLADDREALVRTYLEHALSALDHANQDRSVQ